MRAPRSRRRIVMIYVEPTPYIIALIDTLRQAWGGPIEAHYIATDFSQAWSLSLDARQDSVLPAGHLAGLRAIGATLMRERQQTILHLAGWGHPALLGALVMAKSLRIPVAVESDTAEGRADHTWRRWVKSVLYPPLFRLPDRFFPGGTRQARYLARFGVAPQRMTVAQMTVDVDAIRRFCARDRDRTRGAARSQWGLSANEPVALYVGRLENFKGIELLLSAFTRALTTAKDLRLVIAGDGSLRPQVAACAAEADRRITYLGRLSCEDVLRAYLAADFLVLPSLIEPWGLVVNEAMACGLPVIASDRVGCADDLVQTGETGLLVAVNSEAELAAAMVRLAGNEAVRRHMGQGAENLISNWTLANEARNIMSAWNQIAR